MPTSLDPLRGATAKDAIEKDEITPDLTRFVDLEDIYRTSISKGIWEQWAFVESFPGPQKL